MKKIRIDNINTYPHVRDMKRPLKKGELYQVPCVVRRWENGFAITPVIEHLHDDVENGQRYKHYHADYRFIEYVIDKHDNIDRTFINPAIIQKHSQHIWGETPRPILHEELKLEYITLPVINEEFVGATDVKLIENSKLKRKCIHNNKCPHRGYDLSQVQSVNGIITCPLHGLKFDAITKQLKT